MTIDINEEGNDRNVTTRRDDNSVETRIIDDSTSISENRFIKEIRTNQQEHEDDYDQRSECSHDNKDRENLLQSDSEDQRSAHDNEDNNVTDEVTLTEISDNHTNETQHKLPLEQPSFLGRYFFDKSLFDKCVRGYDLLTIIGGRCQATLSTPISLR